MVNKTIVQETIPDERTTDADNTKGILDGPTVNFIIDTLLPNLRPEEQVVLLRLYRLSYGSRRNTTDFVGYTRLAEQCNISLKTAYRAIKRLIENQYITVIAHGPRCGGSSP
jgi:hypothetical protein